MRQSVPQVVDMTLVVVGTGAVAFNRAQVLNIFLAQPRYSFLVMSRPAKQLELLCFCRTLGVVSHNFDPIWKAVFSATIYKFMRWVCDFEDYVRVGATKAKRVDAGPANAFGPFFGFGDDLKLTA